MSDQPTILFHDGNSIPQVGLGVWQTPNDTAVTAVKAALVVLCGAIGSVVWGALVDRSGAGRPVRKLHFLALLCIASLLVLGLGFGGPLVGVELAAQARFALIAIGGFLMTCTVGPVAAIVIDVIHPGIRATGASVGAGTGVHVRSAGAFAKTGFAPLSVEYSSTHGACRQRTCDPDVMTSNLPVSAR